MEEKIEKLFKKYGLLLNKTQIKSFINYYLLLIEWNEKINLTAITNFDEVIIKHFLDSVLISKDLKKCSTLIDIGTGAGFPSIPLKILRPDLNILMVDSLQKRVNFLDEVIEKLNLQDIKAVHSRAEDLAKDKNYRESFDYSVARAVASLPTLLEYLSPFVKVGGNVIAYKSIKADEEILLSKNALKILNCEINFEKNIEICEINSKRTYIFIKKRAKTDLKYPRGKNLPKTNPL